MCVLCQEGHVIYILESRVLGLQCVCQRPRQKAGDLSLGMGMEHSLQCLVSKVLCACLLVWLPGLGVLVLVCAVQQGRAGCQGGGAEEQDRWQVKGLVYQSSYWKPRNGRGSFADPHSSNGMGVQGMSGMSLKEFSKHMLVGQY